MKHWLVGLSLILGVMFITPTPTAQAWSWSSFFSKKKEGKKTKKRWSYKKPKANGGRNVPELDPSFAGSSMVLLLGGVAYVMSRRREDDELA
ncbi:MAG: hypothetical protein AAF436_19970 [Myxococcota bacterium]